LTPAKSATASRLNSGNRAGNPLKQNPSRMEVFMEFNSREYEDLVDTLTKVYSVMNCLSAYQVEVDGEIQ